MLNKKNTDLRLDLLRYASGKDYFLPSELFRDLDLNEAQRSFVNQELVGSFFKNIGAANGNSEYRYALSLEGNSRLLEYDELSFARKNSHEARILSIIAIIISLISLFVR